MSNPMNKSKVVKAAARFQAAGRQAAGRPSPTDKATVSKTVKTKTDNNTEVRIKVSLPNASSAAFKAEATKAKAAAAAKKKKKSSSLSALKPTKKTTSKSSESSSDDSDREEGQDYGKWQIIFDCSCTEPPSAGRPKTAAAVARARTARARSAAVNATPCSNCQHASSLHKSWGDAATGTSQDSPSSLMHWQCYRGAAFGSIRFKEYFRVAKFVKINLRKEHEKDLDRFCENVWGFMTEVWGLETPSLVLSIADGSEHFQLKTRLEGAFRRGLMTTARQSGAWLITTGLHHGVMKHVGNVVHDCSLMRHDKDNQNVIAIGIAPWRKAVATNVKLLNDGDRENIVEYEVSPESLDPYHTHFLLVDVEEQEEDFGALIDFRVSMEKCISKKDINIDASTQPLQTTNSFRIKVAVALLVVEGGKDTMKHVQWATEAQIPTIVLQDSGRIADILALVAKKSAPGSDGNSGKNREELRAKVMKLTTSGEESQEADSLLELVSKCVAAGMPNLVTVYVVDPLQTESQGLDVAILKAFLNVNKDTKFRKEMELAIAWNRIDVARNEILPNQSFPINDKLAHDRQSVLMTAIKHEKRSEFVRLFVDSDFSLDEFLKPDPLLSLYLHTWGRQDESGGRKDEKGYQDLMVIKENKNKTNNLFLKTKSLQKEMENETGHSEMKKIKEMEDTYNKKKNLDNFVFRKVQKLMDVKFYKKPKYGLKHPNEEASHKLFIWALLSERFDLANVFWTRSTEPIGAAMLATRMIAKMASEDKSNTVRLRRLQEQSDKFEELAIGVLSACHEHNERKTRKLLVRELPMWGRSSCVLLAMKADSKRFLSHPACQGLGTAIWMGKIDHYKNTFWKVMLAMLCPLLILWMIKFRGKHKEQHTSPHNEQHQRLKTIKGNVKKIPIFYTTPAVIFYLNMLSYLGFLMVYGYVLLVKMTDPQIWHYQESLLAMWIITMAFEELRQFTPLSINRSGKIRNKWKNYMDLMTLFMFVVGGGLRLAAMYTACGSCFQWARLVLGLNVIPCFFRFLYFYTINKELGPKLVMIRRMVHDLTWFVVILMVFVAAFAVASEALLYDANSELLTWRLLFDLLRRSYWQIYGEIFLEDIEADSGCVVGSFFSGGQQRCRSPLGPYSVAVTTGVYMLLTNILLINLLIAMFSYTFQAVQDNTDMHWHFQRFNLIFEFTERPWLPPPLSVIPYVISYVRYKIKGKKPKNVYRRRPEVKIDSHWEVVRQATRKFLAFSNLHKSPVVPAAAAYDEPDDDLNDAEEDVDEEEQMSKKERKKFKKDLKERRKARKDAALAQWEKVIADIYISRNEDKSVDLKVDSIKQQLENMQQQIEILIELTKPTSTEKSLAD